MKSADFRSCNSSESNEDVLFSITRQMHFVVHSLHFGLNNGEVTRYIDKRIYACRRVDWASHQSLSLSFPSLSHPLTRWYIKRWRPNPQWWIIDWSQRGSWYRQLFSQSVVSAQWSSSRSNYLILCHHSCIQGARMSTISSRSCETWYWEKRNPRWFDVHIASGLIKFFTCEDGPSSRVVQPWLPSQRWQLSVAMYPHLPTERWSSLAPKPWWFLYIFSPFLVIFSRQFIYSWNPCPSTGCSVFRRIGCFWRVPRSIFFSTSPLSNRTKLNGRDSSTNAHGLCLWIGKLVEHGSQNESSWSLRWKMIDPRINDESNRCSTISILYRKHGVLQLVSSDNARNIHWPSRSSIDISGVYVKYQRASPKRGSFLTI